MLTPDSPKLLLIINPHAGKNQAREKIFSFIDYFSRSGYQVSVFPTTAHGDASQYAAQFAPEFDLVVCVGGDGTLNEVVSGMMSLPRGRRTPLGYIPAGTTNDFASTLGISSKMESAMKQVTGGRIFNCDIGCFNRSTYFTYVAAFGLFTEVSYETPQALKNTLGHFAYILEGIISLASVRSYHFRLEADNEVIEDDFIYGQISNSTSIGGMLSIRKVGIELNDGEFELLLIKMPKNPIELQEIITSLMAQNITNHPLIYFRRARRVHMVSDGTASWTLDGEAGGTFKEITAEIIPNAIPFSVSDVNKEVLVEVSAKAPAAGPEELPEEEADTELLPEEIAEEPADAELPPAESGPAEEFPASDPE